MRRRLISAVFAAAFLLLLPFLATAGEEGRAGGARKLVEEGFAGFTAAQGSPSPGEGDLPAGAAVIAKVFDIDLFSARILAERWPRFSEREREEFRRALSIGLARYVEGFLRERGGDGPLGLGFERRLTSGFLPSGQSVSSYLREQRMGSATMPGLSVRAVDYVMLRYSLRGSKVPTPLFFVVALYPGGTWRVTEVFSAGEGLVGLYRKQVRETLAMYSLPYLLAELSGGSYVVLEDWGAGKAGGLPPGWGWREGDEGKRKPYALRREGGARWLAADDSGESVPLGKEVRWNLRKYPYLSFRWRARRLPEGGDERSGGTNDSAAGVTVVFDLKLGVIPKSIKYVWSSTLAPGSALRREGLGKPWVIVAEGGTDHLGEWRDYVFNVYEAYRRTFGGEPPDVTVGIGILSDANATGSAAAADYGEIRALRQADAGTGIKEFLEPL